MLLRTVATRLGGLGKVSALIGLGNERIKRIATGVYPTPAAILTSKGAIPSHAGC